MPMMQGPGRCTFIAGIQRRIGWPVWGLGEGLGGPLPKAEKQFEQFLDRLVDADTPTVVAAYENRVRKLVPGIINS